MLVAKSLVNIFLRSSGRAAMSSMNFLLNLQIVPDEKTLGHVRGMDAFYFYFYFYECVVLNSGSASRRDAYLLEIEDSSTQRSRPGRTVGESVDGILEMDSSDWSNGIWYHLVDTTPDTEFRARFS